MAWIGSAVSRNWDPATWRVVEEIEGLWGMRCETYPAHGTTGERHGIDILTNERQDWNNMSEHRLALHILAWLKGNEDRFAWLYLIYNDRIYYPGGVWRWYNWRAYGRGLMIEAVQRHGNHIHIQLPRGFYYEAPQLYP